MNSPKPLVDVHVHLAALPAEGNGCYVSPHLLKKRLTQSLLRRLQIDPNDPVAGNRRYVELLLGHIRSSRHTRQAVLLALDGVYDHLGRLDSRHTHFVISNAAVLSLCRQHPEFLAGVSINPLRRDAIDEVNRCVEAGAVLVKWLPNTQYFAPDDPRCRPFYRRLAELRLPLLTHSGYEFTLMGIDQSHGDPGRMRLALEEGVTVIAAHAGSTGLGLWEKHRSVVFRLVRQFPHYYLDSSALCLPNRMGMALIVRQFPDLQNRLLYGSDYPVPVYASHYAFQLGWSNLRRCWRESNPLDKNAEVQQALGFRFAELPRGTILADRCR